MKYWFDTEFIEDGITIDILSIGILAEDGRELYLVSSEANYSKASQWVVENVLPHLPASGERVLRNAIKRAVLEFCDIEKYGKPEMWGYYAAYDWVALCQLFGTMMDLPRGWPMYCRDIKQLCDSLGNPKLPEQSRNEHHALADAQWNREAHEFLQALNK
jgi:hypothetical protein